MKTIQTKYYGPTNKRGSRIRATDGDNTIFVGYHDSEDPHVYAAKMLKEKLGWTMKMVGGHTKDGMVFVFADDIYVI